MLKKDYDRLLNESCSKVLGAIDGCRDNRRLAPLNKKYFSYDTISTDVLFADSTGSELDRTGSSYIESYNIFYNAKPKKLSDLAETLKTEIEDSFALLKDNFSDYEFSIDEDSRQYKIDSEKKIFYCENLLDKLVSNIDILEQNDDSINDAGLQK